jgi:NTP pyrophosphatase (non-canonical NTP hydrolase)
MKHVLALASEKTLEDPMLNATLGLVGESGEIVDIVKKWIFHDHYLAEEHLVEELGDVVYYVFMMMHALNVTLDEVMEVNIAKLKDRYPEGFDPNRSMNRG